jgi:hypothetical protein
MDLTPVEGKDRTDFRACNNWDVMTIAEAEEGVVRTNAMLEQRLPADVDWTLFQQVRNHLVSGRESNDAMAAMKTGRMINFVFEFTKAMNTRLGDRDDLFVLEACSIFKPEDRARNRPMREAYMAILLEKFPHDDPSSIKNASVIWMQRDDYNADAGAASHFIAFAKGSHGLLQDFGKWVLDVLKNIPSNAIVESRFSTAAQARPSSTRMHTK